MLGINTIRITPKILRQVSDIDMFKGLWHGLDRHTTGLQLLGDVADYGAKFESVLAPLKEKPLSPDVICLIHASQMGHTDKRMSTFKTTPIPLAIKGKNRPVGMLDTALPQDVEPLLAKLCDWVNMAHDQNDLHPLLIIAVFAAVFLQISPFETGNLRTVCFLIMLLMIKSEYTYAPYASLSPIMEDTAEDFYSALQHNQTSLEAGQADWSAWLDYFLTLLRQQKTILHGRLYGKEKELQNLPALSARIMELFKQHQRLQMKDIIRLTKGRRATIKLRLTELLNAGYLRRHGQGRSTWYGLV